MNTYIIFRIKNPLQALTPARVSFFWSPKSPKISKIHFLRKIRLPYTLPPCHAVIRNGGRWSPWHIQTSNTLQWCQNPLLLRNLSNIGLFPASLSMWMGLCLLWLQNILWLSVLSYFFTSFLCFFPKNDYIFFFGVHRWGRVVLIFLYFQALNTWGAVSRYFLAMLSDLIFYDLSDFIIHVIYLTTF